MDQPPFETRAQRRARQRQERKTAAPPRSRRVWIWVLVGAGVIGGATWWLMARPHPTTAQQTAAARQRHADLVAQCTTDAATVMHIHPHIRIVINGDEQAVPTDVGISATCQRALHTHDGTGVIHVESPRQDDFTLADFFSVWGKSLSSTKVLDTSLDDQHQLKFFVNGKAVTTGPQTIMRDRESLAIVIAPSGSIVTPPTNYQFPSSL